MYVYSAHCLLYKSISMYCLYVNCLYCTVWSTLSRISLTKALVLWWCDNKSDLIWTIILVILTTKNIFLSNLYLTKNIPLTWPHNAKHETLTHWEQVHVIPGKSQALHRPLVVREAVSTGAIWSIPYADEAAVRSSAPWRRRNRLPGKSERFHSEEAPTFC